MSPPDTAPKSSPDHPRSIHTWAWVNWLVAAVILISSTRNPLYLLITFLCILVTYSALANRQSALADSFKPIISPLRFSGIVILLSTAFNSLTSHYGQTVIMTFPGNIPLISGPLTLEALAYGAINGLVLSSLFASFSVISLALPVRALIRLIPRAFFPVAVVTSIAVTYVPSTTRQFRQIREAQALRGHKLRGLGDWLPLIIPLLVGGLERAMQLAEAMTARGFASSVSHHQKALPRLGMLTGLLLFTAGWMLRLSGRNDMLSLPVMIAGVCLVGWGLWSIGRGVPRTAYRREAWRLPDLAIVFSALIPIAAYLLPFSIFSTVTLSYSPYPVISLPPFDPLLGVATLGLLTPGVLIASGTAM